MSIGAFLLLKLLLLYDIILTMITSDQKAQQFLDISDQFRLGGLTTEAIHPLTRNLSYQADSELNSAIRTLHQVDLLALVELRKHICQIYPLARDIQRTLKNGRKVYICGCGATGRLALTLETLWRQNTKNKNMRDSVRSFMAGGDTALIRSIENFEDFADYGRRQLMEMEFSAHDLLIACTEGGETPFVIGAALQASEFSSSKPWFLYCNPDKELMNTAIRSRNVIANPAINKISLPVGPMAIAGSTRMQASTALLMAIGICLLNYDKNKQAIDTDFDIFFNYWEDLNTDFLEPFINFETQSYRNQEHLFYETDPAYGITLLTDTTERAPTFSLFPFENFHKPSEPSSWCYLCLPGTNTSRTAWQQLLCRKPRTLEWPELKGLASKKQLMGFDISKNIVKKRQTIIPGPHHCFRIIPCKAGLIFYLKGNKYVLRTPFQHDLYSHLLLKMILNTHSTLVMGRMGRYQGNIMTWVKASNNKLIDRAIRYIRYILKDHGITSSYNQAACYCFRAMEYTPSDQSLVLTVVNEILIQKKMGRLTRQPTFKRRGKIN